MNSGSKPMIGFIGQGWIGKNYADDFERRGFQVVRYALEEPYKANKDKIKDCDIVFIAVPTPTTPQKGCDVSIVESAVASVGEGKIAVVKSTILPGTIARLQKKYPAPIVLYSPEFLSEATAAHDAAHPFSNIVGMPEGTPRHHAAAALVHGVLPEAPFTLTCSSTEAEIVKYAHNGSAYTQVMFFNMMYDLASTLGADWGAVHRAVLADPFIQNRYAQPVHKSGRGAGGGCFIKDFAALRELYEHRLPRDKEAAALLRAHEAKNIALLRESGKDLDLLSGVYGADVLADIAAAARPAERIPVADIGMFICAQSADESDPTLGFFHAWVAEFARRTRHVSLAYLQGTAADLPDNVRAFSLGKDKMRGPRWWKRARYTVRFWWYAWRERHAYDTVLVYINTEYLMLGGLLWRALGKKVALISNQKEAPWKVYLAARFADVLLYTDPNAVVARLPLSQRIAAGIDTRAYLHQARRGKPLSLLFMGRIAREKRLDAVIEAVGRAAKDLPGLHLDIYGAAVVGEDAAYEKELRARYRSLEERGLVSFRGEVPHTRTPEIYASHDVFMHAGSVSGFNKALFEAMAAGCTIVPSEPALRGVVRDDLFIDDVNPESLTRAIRAAAKLKPEERTQESAVLRAYVEREHSLGSVVPGILETIYPTTESTRSVGL